jgi:hypothetical protein
MIDNAMAEQWPILHQPKHERSSVFGVWSFALTGLDLKTIRIKALAGRYRDVNYFR